MNVRNTKSRHRFLPLLEFLGPFRYKGMRNDRVVGGKGLSSTGYMSGHGQDVRDFVDVVVMTKWDGFSEKGPRMAGWCATTVALLAGVFALAGCQANEPLMV